MKRHHDTEASVILPILLIISPASAFLRRNNSSNERHLRTPIKWWYNLNPSLPGGGECVQSSDYPANYPVDFPKLLYNSKDECCDNHKDVTCLLKVTTTTTTSTKATLPTLTEAPSSSPLPKPVKWYPFEDGCVHDSLYPEWMSAGLNSYTYLFDSQADCCTVHSCNIQEDKWYPVNTNGEGFDCVYNNDYPVDFLQHANEMLFDSKMECCEVYCGVATTTTTTPEMKLNSGTVAPPIVVTNPPPIVTDHESTCNKKWHISTLSSGANTCTNDAVYPPTWENTNHLHATAQSCCDKYFPNSPCTILDHCACHQNWHLSIQPGEIETCTNDEDYPESWHLASYQYLFVEPKECCLKNFGVEECRLRDVCESCVDTWHVNPSMPSGSW